MRSKFFFLMDEPSFLIQKLHQAVVGWTIFRLSSAGEWGGKRRWKKKKWMKNMKNALYFFSVFSNKNCYVCTNRVRACARCGCCCLSDDCVDRTAAIDSLWQATMKCISTVSIFFDQVPLIGNNFLQHSSSQLECLESILSVGRDSHKIEFHSTMHHQQHDAERESWMNLIDWHFSFCCCFSFAEFIHDQSAAVARHTYCEFDRTESNFCFFPSHQHPPSPPAWPKACVWYHIPPNHHQKMPSKQPYNLVKEDQPDFKNIYPDEAFLKGISFNVKVTIDVPHFSLAAIFILWYFFPPLRRLMISSLFTPQLIGFQEVQRPTSRTEIVQAMRRIRVS